MGTFKALEVTYNSKAKTYHPHFHVLLAVNNSYFKGRNYIKHSQWLELWRKATKDNSITQVDVRAVTSNKKRSSSSDIESAAAEVGKYSTKPSDYLKKLPDGSYSANSSIVKDLAVNLKGRRLTSYTGVLKEHYMKLKLQDVESDNIDLVHISNDDDMIDAVMIQVYKWNVGLKNYIN
jgi:plasmid rolling circle replication initiator protein Rep